MEELVALIFIGFGTIFGCLVLWKLYHTIKSSIQKDQPSISEDDFDRLARAFIQHRKKINNRVQNIEAIIAHDDNISVPEVEESESHSKGTLKNDLKNKKRVR